MSYKIKDDQVRVNWTRINNHCNNKISTRTEYWQNVDYELSKFNATYDQDDSILTFESHEYFTWFILKWS